MQRLNEIWQVKTQTLERKLADSVEQCGALTNSLTTVTQDLKRRRIRSLEREQTLVRENECLQRQLEEKTRDLQEAFSFTHEKMTKKV